VHISKTNETVSIIKLLLQPSAQFLSKAGLAGTARAHHDRAERGVGRLGDVPEQRGDRRGRPGPERWDVDGGHAGAGRGHEMQVPFRRRCLTGPSSGSDDLLRRGYGGATTVEPRAASGRLAARTVEGAVHEEPP